VIAEKYTNIRRISLEIAAPLSSEDMLLQSMPEASPIKWHLAHTSWAFETFVLKYFCENYQAYDQRFEYLFNSYYNSVGQQYPRNQRGLLSRPNIAQVLEYRKHIDRAMLALIAELKHEGPEQNSNNRDAIIQRINLAINHEQQHQELMITDLKHAFFTNPSYPVYRQAVPPKYLKTELAWKKYAAGVHSIGHQDEYFYFDNEGPRHKVYIEPFRIACRLVTCGEYLSFIENGGYQQASYWLSEAWSKIQTEQIDSPFYWLKKRDGWYQYHLSGLQPIDLNAPMSHVNYFEANAYANSIGKRLPTEQEWEVASTDNTTRGSYYKVERHHPNSACGSGLEQMFGELWQWTSSSYSPYPGFRIPDGAVGEYNGKFMVNQYVLRGGSIATPKGHIRPSYRNFFYPDACWQYSGIRLAESL
jgi:ergothioneine biosynthesis protein EgtB